MGGDPYVRFSVGSHEFEVYANIAGTMITALPEQEDPITLLYNIAGLVQAGFVEKQLMMHQRYKWFITPIVSAMEGETAREPYQRSSLPVRLAHSLLIPRVMKNLRLLKQQRKAVGLCESLKAATDGGLRLYNEIGLDELIGPILEVDALHGRMVEARKRICEIEQANYNAFYF